MKTLIFVLASSLFTTLGFSQETANYEEIKLESPSDYKAAEGHALRAANFLLSTPNDPSSDDRRKSSQFLIRWMSGTPDYSFGLDESTKVLIDANLLNMYMAATAKYCLENPDHSKEAELVKVSSWKIVLSYCDDPKNNVKMTKKLKKLSEANKNGTLEKSL
jgi:hypothetical protein